MKNTYLDKNRLVLICTNDTKAESKFLTPSAFSKAKLVRPYQVVKWLSKDFCVTKQHKDGLFNVTHVSTGLAADAGHATVGEAENWLRKTAAKHFPKTPAPERLSALSHLGNKRMLDHCGFTVRNEVAATLKTLHWL